MANFFEGLAQGLQGLPQEIDRLRERQERNRAMTALGQVDWTKSADSTGGPGFPSAPSSAASPSGLMALAKPMAGAPAQPTPQTGPVPQAGPAAGPAFQGPAQVPHVGFNQAYANVTGRPVGNAQPSPVRPQPDPSLSPTAQPDVQFDNPIAEANHAWGTIVNSIKMANPGIDPKTLMQAAEMQLDNVKGLAPTTKAIMSAQIGLLRDRDKYQYLGMKLNDENEMHATRMQEIARNNGTKEALEAENERHHTVMEGLYRDNFTSRDSTRLEGVRETNANRINIAKLQGSNRVEVQGMRDSAAADRVNNILAGKRGPAMVAALAKIQAAGLPVTEDTIGILSAQFGDGSSSGASAPSRSAPAPRASGAPKLGTKRGGYTYIGGDPSKPSSWKKGQ